MEGAERLLKYEHGQVTFTARKGTTHRGGDKTEDVNLPVQEFARRWCLHIIPHGFTKTRGYGGYSNHHCKRYVAECCQLRQELDASSEASERPPVNDTDEAPSGRRCPTCDRELELIERVHRTSWRDIFSGADCPSWNTFRERPG